MTISSICVGAVITVFILIGTGLLGMFMNWVSDDDAMCLFPWLLTSIGFGVCLTILLYQNGIIS